MQTQNNMTENNINRLCKIKFHVFYTKIRCESFFYNPFSSSMVCCMLYTYLNCPAMKCSLAKQAAHETYVVCSYTYPIAKEMREIEKKY